MDAEQEIEEEINDALVGELRIRIGQLEFSGKGQQGWLATQLKTVVAAVPSVPSALAEESTKGSDRVSHGTSSRVLHSNFSASLASHIKAKGASGNQTLRFLVTADWLRLRGSELLTTTAIAKALLDNHQTRLANPADCLNKNVAKGFCEKTKEGFFITPEGMEELGHPV